jgi:hypothetical protein
MGRALVACALLVASASTGGEAAAQKAPNKYKAQPLNLHREKLGSIGLGETARARMKAGDCSGAIESFDAALRTSADATLRRDRGLCHESLGDAYPAIDDYRAYLAVFPDARDADGIRERLAALEQTTLGYSSASTDAPGDVEGAQGAEARSDAAAGGSASAGAAGTATPSAKASTSASAPASSAGTAMDYADREDDPQQAPLRRGKGWTVSPFLSEHKWGASPGRVALSSGASSSFGDGGTWAECISLQVRRSFGPMSALFIEAGYEHFNSTGIDGPVVSGLTSQIGYEVRWPLDVEFTNQFILGLGLGFEHLSVAPGEAQFASVSMGAFVPRARAGWRRLLAPSAAFEASLDLGATNFFRYSKFPYDSNDPTTYLVGLNVALVWGL